MSADPSAFELEQFELVEAMPGTMLLRVVGRSEAGIATDQATLTVEADRHSYRFTALPSPSARNGLLRLGFLVPRALLAGELSFSLEVGDRLALELPKPTRGRTVAVPMERRGEGASARLAEARNMVVVALEEALAERDARIVELERELEEAQARAADRAQLTSELENVKEQLRRFQDRARAQQAKLLRRIDTLEADLARAKASPRGGGYSGRPTGRIDRRPPR